MPQSFNGRPLPIALLHAVHVAALFACVSALCSPVHAGDASDEVAPSTIPQYRTTKSTRDFRVTLLGISKGLAFLGSQDLVAGGGREHGDNAVPWVKIAVMVEVVADRASSHAPIQLSSFDVLATDGRDLVGPISIQTESHSIVSRASGTAQMELDFQHLAPTIYPTAAPKAEPGERASVFVLTLSGDVGASDMARLQLRLGAKPEYQEVIFENVPLP